MRFLSFLVLPFPAVAFAGAPDCSGIERWPTKMAFVHLKNAGLVGFVWEKTKTVRLSSEKIGKDLYRQVHLVTFTDGAGKTVDAITVNDASNEECSMSGVDVFVVSKRLGP